MTKNELKERVDLLEQENKCLKSFIYNHNNQIRKLVSFDVWGAKIIDIDYYINLEEQYYVAENKKLKHTINLIKRTLDILRNKVGTKNE